MNPFATGCVSACGVRWSFPAFAAIRPPKATISQISLEVAQLNSFARKDVRHNPNVIFLKRIDFRFFNLFQDYPRLTFMRELRQ